MKHSEFVKLSARLQEARMPHIVFGPPGCGKTEGLLQACRAAGRRAIVTHPVIQEEVDWRGLPGFVQNPETHEMRAVFLPFGFLRDLVSGTEPTTVIIDDVGQARLSVQAALMQAVHLREIDGARISDNVTWALASNRREDRAAVQGMVSALLDRMVCALTLDFDAEELSRYLIARDYPSILAAFVRFRAEAIKFDAKDEFAKSSTPRSIEGLGKLLNLGLDGPEVCGGAVGKAFAAEFLAYRKVESKLPKITDILKAPDKAAVPEERDVLYALTCALSGALDSKTLGAGITYLERIPPEFAVYVMKDVLARSEQDSKAIPDVHKHPAFSKWARANAKLLGV